MNKIRKLIREVLGVQESVKSFSKIISKDIIEATERNFSSINDGSNWGFTTKSKSPFGIIEDTKISLVKVNIDFKFSEQFLISGKFKINNTILLADDTYEIYIDLNLETNNIDNLFKKIQPFIEHELNHAFVNIKDLKGKRRAFTKNSANRITNITLKDLIEKNPPLKQLTKLIYLANPYEVQARVQETGANLEHINEKTAEETAEETINALLKFSPLRDATEMMAFKLDEIKKVNKDDLELFIKTFNDNIKIVSKEENPKTIYDVDKFLDYWQDVIYYKGRELANKIYKLVADKYNMHEAFLYLSTEDGAYRRIFGEIY